MYLAATFVAFVACLVWAIAKPGYDSVTAAIIAFAALIGVFYSSKGKASAKTQTVSSGGVGIQSDGNVNVNNITTKK
jgi:uncharacterized ion transporter superfamily protein YfcC